MGLLDKFGITPEPIEVPTASSDPLAGLRRRGHLPPVGNSKDLHRILALPRRGVPSDMVVATLINSVRKTYGRDNPKCGCAAMKRPCANEARPVQAWALREMEMYGALCGPIGVGHGKTLLDLLAPMAVPNCRVAVLLLPPNLKAQLLQFDWSYYEQHWNLPNLAGARWFTKGRPVLHVVGYSELSGAASTELLESIRPDLIICDEAHNLRRRESARTKRFLRYFSAHPETRLCAWSGTLTTRSLTCYAHLFNLALREGSPTPIHWPTVEEWATALDANPACGFNAEPGPLAQLIDGKLDLIDSWHKKLRETPGVVSSGDASSCDASLQFYERKVALPPKLEEIIRDVRKTWTRPDGEEFTTALDVARCLEQLACGLFYRWKFPRGEPVELIERWFNARKEWNREVRSKLAVARPHMDSPLLLAKAAIRYYSGYEGPLPVWASDSWRAWHEVHKLVRPVQETVWVDDFLVRDAAAWVRSNKGVFWYETTAFGHAVAKAAGAPLFGSNADTPGADEAILREDGSRGIVASYLAHGTGKNLTQWAVQCLGQVPSSGDLLEQILGRLHRPGQTADEVDVHVYRHVPELREALSKAIDSRDSPKLMQASYAFAI